MPLYTKLTPTQANDQVTIERIKVLAKKQNFIFDQILSSIVPGITTADLADIARVAAKEIGVEFSFRKTFSFPEDISICRNHEIMNGIPKHNTRIEAGDLVKISLGTNDAMSAFCSQNWTMLVGEEKSSPAKIHLMSSTLKCLENAIQMCTPNAKISSIVTALHEVALAEKIVLSKNFVGHLIGREPIIFPQFVLPKGLIGEDHTLSTGTMFSLLALGHAAQPHEKLAADNWTVIDKERLPSAVFSHIVLIGDNGPELLTSTYK
ncbi:methionyl aminopeptidase [Undibacterium sp. CY7W]|uniref:Methionyl aminopeptidase n=1 Tax=Undibacterium rugosum TaxID=2762291 RepID=A0A923KT05_9BURK|nr:methionyl aminopeptidase [Undibacterium rugosum]MBC3935509.1 methionyl aminopeptidase [Undibacterium rugosum]